MSVKVSIPAGLRGIARGVSQTEVEGQTVAQVIENLEAKCPGLKEKICEADGSVRTLVNIFVNTEDVRFTQGPATPVADGDTISIILAMAGG